jgi:hypothetical protein
VDTSTSLDFKRVALKSSFISTSRRVDEMQTAELSKAPRFFITRLAGKSSLESHSAHVSHIASC